MNRWLTSWLPGLAMVSGLISVCFFEVQVSWKWRINIVARMHRLGPEYSGALLSTFEATVCIGVVASICILLVSHCCQSDMRKRRFNCIFYSVAALLMLVGVALLPWYHNRERSRVAINQPFLLISYICSGMEALCLLLGAVGCCYCRPRPRDDFYIHEQREKREEERSEMSTVFNQSKW